MNTATTVVALGLLMYFLWRSLRQRVFLLGLPFLMDMYYSVFFDRLKLFWVGGPLGPADRMMLWLLITWVIYFDLVLPTRRRSIRERHLFGPRLSLPEEAVLMGFVAYVLFRVATTAVQHMDLGSAISQARIPLYMFGGYFLLRGILCSAGRKETVDFVAAIVVVNTIAAAFFVLHQGLHMYIYTGMVELSSFVRNGQTLTRSFYFMPQYLPLAIAFCAAKRKWTILWVGVLVVTLAAIWLSYTRALIVVTVVEVAVILAVRILKRHDAGRAVRRTVQIVLVIGVFVAAAVTLLPTQSNYLFSRIEETRAQDSVLQDNNMQVRWFWWRTTHEWVSGNDLFGVGYPTPAQDGRATRVDEMAADLVWVPLLWNLGLLGVAGFAVVFVVYGWRAVSQSLTSEGDAALLSVTMLGVIVGVFLLGFQEWTVLDPWHTPLALSFLVFLVAERCRQRSEAPEVATSTKSSLIAPESTGGY